MNDKALSGQNYSEYILGFYVIYLKHYYIIYNANKISCTMYVNAKTVTSSSIPIHLKVVKIFDNLH